METTSTKRFRLSNKQKEANNYQWYKDEANRLDTHTLADNQVFSYGSVNELKRMQVNYDLFNNIVNMADLNYVCKPFGEDAGDLPANFANRDIVSGKIKVLLGMEMKMPFSWRVVAVNEEASTRKEDEEFGKIKDFVTSSIMQPLRMMVQQEYAKQQQGQDLTPQQKQDLQAQIQQEIEAKTPDKVRIYMAREHQDPAEALARQLLEYLILEKKLNFKFNKGWKHSCLSGKELYWVGILNGEPDMEAVNPLYFKHDKGEDLDFVEDGEWALREMRMTPAQIVGKFGSELKPEDIDRIFNHITIGDYGGYGSRDEDFTFNSSTIHDPTTVRVVHFNWKALKPVQFLTYLDKNGKEQEMLVDENYRLKPQLGDIKLEREWIPMAYECYKILDDIFVHCREVPGQYKDLDNLWDCKLSYYGAATDSLNSPTTAPMDRMKNYQYLFDIVLYRIELLMASDKGKIMVANINSIPKSSGINMEKFQYFMEANKIAWVNPQEEGNRPTNTDVKSFAGVIDMSLISDIKKYMEIAEYIERKCGAAIGVTPQMEAQIAANEAVTNTQQNLVQSSYIIQPYFELHNVVKANVLQALVDTAKVAYSGKQPRKLSYVLDDMTYKMLTIDPVLLEMSKYGLYVANSAKASDAKRAVEQLAQAALQNQQADISDIVKVIMADSVNEANELLEAAQARKASEAQAGEQVRAKQVKDAQDSMEQMENVKHQNKLEEITTEQVEKRKTALQVEAMRSLAFDPNKDEDNDGTPDVMEVYKFGLDADIKKAKQQLEEQHLGLEQDKFSHQKTMDAHQKTVDNQKLENDKEKIKVSKMKKPSSGK